MAATDHPCVCGEKERRNFMPKARVGSPLRMRGKEGHYEIKIVAGRITPAYAGKRKADKCQSPEHRDHPCVCGEKHGRHGGSF